MALVRFKLRLLDTLYFVSLNFNKKLTPKLFNVHDLFYYKENKSKTITWY